MKKESEAEAMKECTFHPQITKKSSTSIGRVRLDRSVENDSHDENTNIVKYLH